VSLPKLVTVHLPQGAPLRLHFAQELHVGDIIVLGLPPNTREFQATYVYHYPVQPHLNKAPTVEIYTKHYVPSEE
jgi:hypothetical protein